MALPEMTILYIFLIASVYFLAQSYLQKRRKKKVLIVANDPALLDHEFVFDRVDVKKLNDVHAVRDLIFNRPDAVVIDYGYDDRKAGRQLFKVCQINNIPAIMVCGQTDKVCVSPDNIIRKEANYFKDINDWLARKVA